MHIQFDNRPWLAKGLPELKGPRGGQEYDNYHIGRNRIVRVLALDICGF